MAKDITIRVTGQNPDGTMNVQQVGGDGGNPFGTPGTNTGIVPYQQPTAVTGYRARIGNSDVMFASEADFLKADRELRGMYNTAPGVPVVGGGSSFGGSMGSGGGWLRTGGNAARTVADYLAARNLRSKIRDLDDALAESSTARRDLDALEQSGKYNDLIPILRRALLAERDATDSSISALEDQVTALDINAGAGVAETVAEFIRPEAASFGGGGSGVGTAVAVGGVGLGLGMLLAQDRDRRRRRR